MVVVVAFVAVPLAAGFEEGKTLSDIFLFLFLARQELCVNCGRRERGEGM